MTDSTITKSDGVNVQLGDYNYTYLLSSGSDNSYTVLNGYCYSVQNTDGSTGDLRVDNYKYDKSGNIVRPKQTLVKLVFFVTSANNYLNLYFVTKALYADGTIVYKSDARNGFGGNIIPLPANYVLTNGYVSMPVDTINIDNVNDVNEAIAHSVGSVAEGIQADIQKVIDAVNQGTATDTAISKSEAQDLLGIKEYIKALEAAQERTIDAIKEGTKEDDMNVPQLPATITDKFPFCVPFDLIALVKTFNATPEAPKVTVPVVFQSMNYSHDFVFDFSGDDWDKVAAVSRWGILLFFMLGLTLVTRKLIKG